MKQIIKRSLIILAGLGLTKSAYSQAPNISYATPQTYTVGTTITPLAVSNSGGAVAINGQTSTFAGSGTAGNGNGTGTGASFSGPNAMAFDNVGNLYVADYSNHLIRKITPAGVVSTFAGSGTAGSSDGTGTAASFNYPFGIAVDALNNVYVADRINNMVRMITPGGVVTTLAGSTTAGNVNGTGTAARFNQPAGLAVDAAGNIFVSDFVNSEIRKIAPGGVVTTFAGTGTAGSANGTGTLASFNGPSGMAFDASGNLYVADRYNNMIRMITPAAVVSTFAGSTTASFLDATGTAARFNIPIAIGFDAAGNMYIADYGNNRIRKITPGAVVTTLAGTGTASRSACRSPRPAATAAAVRAPVGLRSSPARPGRTPSTGRLRG